MPDSYMPIITLRKAHDSPDIMVQTYTPEGLNYSDDNSLRVISVPYLEILVVKPADNDFPISWRATI
ncbi:MAG: hypothetical protein ACFFCW_34420 [Candidatus Hodarchaeota archaeon]